MKEWYLMGSQTRPNSLGGYENQAFLDFKGDAFYEALDTDIASTVEVCNYNLRKRRKVRCIVQGNVADTYLKSLERTILFPIGTVKAGEYVFFENRYWIITGYPGNNHVYEKVTVALCQYLLRWQNAKGHIIERWVNITSASKYDIGEKGDKVMLLPSDDFMIFIPNDKESLNIDDTRVFIDQNKENPIKVFKITRNDDSFYEYGEHGGVLSLIAHRDTFNADTDNQDLMICDYVDPDDPKPSAKTDIIAKIEASSPVIRVNTTGRKFYAKFYNKDGEELPDVVPYWTIEADFVDELVYTTQDDYISIATYNEDLIDRTFTLKLTDEGKQGTVAEIVVTIEGMF